MKSITSCSLFPAASCSRIWLRRSTASGALESASVWFWQTRQRSSLASAPTRLSISGVWAAASPQATHSSNALASPIQFLHQRLQFLTRHLGRERPDVLVADHPALVDDV